MNTFRKHILSKIATFATAVLFLNMSFLLAEVTLLEMHSDSRFARIVSLIISGTCLEEEREVGGDSGEEDAKKKIDVFFHCHPTSDDRYFLLSELQWILHQSMLLQASIDTLTPPPKS